ncbi:MAG: sugar transferase [Clostridium sp.]|jgi:lipopolysaccharide/colanic/teichoic acid biosynthesis glycosyltransferase|uniref:sugar transferase n=1 Tax=Clostridium TaxID=1485 RepID=UPI0018A9AA49|nr:MULTISPECIES: sugar transferase [Clostridium]MBS6501065.1 sugar transferase [Clostridium sp.]MDB1934323.1 sugar transferase [Clostridium tertium]MDB1935823.1 sugar transferase [Clostridium tertium]MDB1969618.1 sugar transferase [Clostridium tertium]MDU1278899.1 sugar transferase [Clostridium sp.]
MNKFNQIVKRIFDFLVSLIGIIILSPIFVIVSIAIKLDSRGEVLFLQKRVGRYGKEFNIYKFRTMVTNAEKIGKQITVGKDSRITRVGAFLRKFKIDELPQLFNVLKGDMSLVGPRPEVPKYVALYNEEQRHVLDVRPGITDMASLRYKDENDILGKVDNPEEYYINIIMRDKLNLNLEYIEKSNLFFDIYLIIKTIIKCL